MEFPIMSEAADKPATPSTEQGVQIVGSAAAPFIFFDRAAYQTIEGGVIGIELVALTMVAIGNGRAKSEIVATAHLRCSAEAFQSLKAAVNAIDLALAPGKGPAN